MSVRWLFKFRVDGPDESVSGLAETLHAMKWSEEPQGRLFTDTTIVDRQKNRLEAEIGRNYYGREAVEEMVERFPGLCFEGCGSTNTCESFYEFVGRNGEVKWTGRDMEWHPGFFTAHSQFERLDGQPEKAKIEIADPSLWAVLAALSSMTPAQAAKFVEAVQGREEPAAEPPVEAKRFASALDRVVRLLTADYEPPRLVACFGNEQAEDKGPATGAEG